VEASDRHAINPKPGVTDAPSVVVVGAGPHGLATAANLEALGIDVRVFGEPMSFWERHMPRGMLLKSSWRASHIAHPDLTRTLDSYEQATGASLPRPIPMERFIEYGRWFGERLAAAIDRRMVTRIDARGDGFRVALEDGEVLEPRRVVVAAGVAPFARRPGQFAELPEELATHSFDWDDLARFEGRRVAVIGAGQSALESAALLHEHGAEVEILVREPLVRYILANDRSRGRVKQMIRAAASAPTEVGPRGLSWVAAIPDLYRAVPSRAQPWVSYRCLIPFGSPWLTERLAGVPVATSCAVTRAARRNGHVRLSLSDGTQRDVDHVLLGTGYQVDVGRYPFLPEEIVRRLRLVDGHPPLRSGLESRVPGLHFVGAPAGRSFGPIMRFVVGSWYAAPSVASRIAGKRPRPMRRAFP
jgi:FAD-dependent urate hydroxylase